MVDMQERLEGERRRLGLTDSGFARLLGVPRQTWQAARDGHRPIGRGLTLAAVRVFPFLRAVAIAHFLSEDTEDTAEMKSA